MFCGRSGSSPPPARWSSSRPSAVRVARKSSGPIQWMPIRPSFSRRRRSPSTAPYAIPGKASKNSRLFIPMAPRRSSAARMRTYRFSSCPRTSCSRITRSTISTAMRLKASSTPPFPPPPRLRPRGGPEGRRVVDGGEVLYRLGGAPDLPLQVGLVRDEEHGHGAGDLGGDGDPVVQALQGGGVREVAHGDQPLRADEEGVLHHVAEAPLAHDVEEDHVDVDLEALGAGDDEGDLRHLPAHGLEVLVVELVEGETPDERGLPDAALPHHADLRFQLQGAG